MGQRLHVHLLCVGSGPGSEASNRYSGGMCVHMIWDEGCRESIYNEQHCV